MSMTIGKVLEALREAPPSAQVVRFDFGHCQPTHVGSWRGIYAEPALGWSEPCGRPAVKTSELINELERAIDGRTFEGWKGGDYHYCADDTLHVDNPGECTMTELSKVSHDDYSVVLHTYHKRDL